MSVEKVFTIHLPLSIYAFGALANLGILSLVIWKRPVRSQSTITLLIIQLSLDCVACLVGLAYLLQPDYWPNSLPDASAAGQWVYCRLVYGRTLFAPFNPASVNNHICMALDRYFAVMAPTRYRDRSRRTLFISLVVLVTLDVVEPLAMASTTALFIEYDGVTGRCIMSGTLHCLHVAVNVVWVVTTVIIPAAVFTFCYGRLSRTLLSVSPLPPATNEGGQGSGGSYRQLFIAMLIFAVVYSVNKTWLEFLFWLNTFGVISSDSVLFNLIVVFPAIPYSVNPVIMLASMSKLWTTAKDVFNRRS